MAASLPLNETLSSLPPRYNGPDPHQMIKDYLESDTSSPVLVVLDDDPTGTQTCNNIAVLTTWEIDVLIGEFQSGARGFFILTNSRAYPPKQARDLMRTICSAVKQASEIAETKIEIVLRGDSTLRGHFPLEPDIAEEVFGAYDCWIFAPFFSEGGRLTINDIHYVKTGDQLVPAAQTPFAADASFGYTHSNLREYVEEKAPRRFSDDRITSVTISDIRKGGPKRVQQILQTAKTGSVVIVNAADRTDMDVFCAGLLQTRAVGKRFLYRTGAAFVSSVMAVTPIPPISSSELGFGPTEREGALIVAGSHIPKTTAQLTRLIERRANKLHVIELHISQLTALDRTTMIQSTTRDIDKQIRSGKDVLLMTNRKLVVKGDANDNLDLGSQVMDGLVWIVRALTARPKYIVAKGGITSSDIASKALGTKRAKVIGQAAPGVPLWICDDAEAKYPCLPYVVFPGNVGDDDSLADLIERWQE